MNIIIFEDDPLIALDIKSVIETTDSKVVGVFHKFSELNTSILTSVDLALLDINLGDSVDGIEIGINLREKHNIPSIFISSYYDLKTVDRAKTVQPLAYIIKPYEEQDILINLELSKYKIIELKSESIITEEPFLVKSGSSYVKIFPNEILYGQAYDIYTHLYTAKKRHTISMTLKEVTIKLKPYDFLRIHRSYVINLKVINGIGSHHILIEGNQIPIGRTYKKELMSRFSKF